MKLREAFLWQPGWAGRSLILLGGALVVTAVGYVHALTGLAYEFHLFFVVPVLVVSWFLGSRFGYAVALLAAVEWFLADRLLERLAGRQHPQRAGQGVAAGPRRCLDPPAQPARVP